MFVTSKDCQVSTNRLEQVPGTAQATSHLSVDEIEIGMGIHNEPGHRRLSPIPKLSDLISELLKLLTSQESDRAFVPFAELDNEVVVLVNNLGGLSELELGGIVKEVRRQLDASGYSVRRLLAGTFMVSETILDSDESWFLT